MIPSESRFPLCRSRITLLDLEPFCSHSISYLLILYDNIHPAAFVLANMVQIDSIMHKKVVDVLSECALRSDFMLAFGCLEGPNILSSGRSGIIVKVASHRVDCATKPICVKILFATDATAAVEFNNAAAAYRALNGHSSDVRIPRHYAYHKIMAEHLKGYHAILMEYLTYAIVSHNRAQAKADIQEY